MSANSDRCAVLTPRGRGAIATIIVQGPSTASTIRKLFRPAGGTTIDFLDASLVQYGTWQPADPHSAGEGLVLCPVSADRVEIHCHGGVAAVQAIVDSLVDTGFKLTPEHDWVPERQSRWAMETLRVTQQAATRRTAIITLAQLDIAHSWWETVSQWLQSQQAEPMIRAIDAAVARRSAGKRLTEPATVVFCGQPNVGKSSLINALLGFDRSIVHDTPGTTRDRVSHVSAIAGWPVLLQDTAGIRKTDDLIERQGVRVAARTIAAADIVVQVLDSTCPADQSLDPQRNPDLVVYNKVDLETSNRQTGPRELETSALSGQGIPDLLAALAELVAMPTSLTRQMIPLTQVQVNWLVSIRALVENQRWEEANQFVNSIGLPPPEPSNDFQDRD